LSVYIQKAVYTALTNSAALMAAVNGVYDHPDPNAALPIVSIGESETTDAGTKTEDSVEYTTIINVWHDALNFAAVKTIQQHIRDALHRQALSVDSGTVTLCREDFSEVIPEGDGETRGIQRFRIFYTYA
jgi:hypothetical protein